VYPKDEETIRKEIQYVPKKNEETLTASELKSYVTDFPENTPIGFMLIKQMGEQFSTHFSQQQKINKTFINQMQKLHDFQQELVNSVNSKFDTMVTNETITNMATNTSQVVGLMIENTKLVNEKVVGLENTTNLQFQAVTETLKLYIDEQKTFTEQLKSITKMYDTYTTELQALQQKNSDLQVEVANQMQAQGEQIKKQVEQNNTFNNNFEEFLKKLPELITQKQPKQESLSEKIENEVNTFMESVHSISKKGFEKLIKKVKEKHESKIKENKT
jgi:hypothetical protein